jgi:uncharacterized protein (TIGR02001 family)
MMKQGMSVLAAAATMMLASPSAMAWELTGNVGAFSNYMFRGVDQSGEAAVQGGLDAAAENGFYAGIWASNLADGETEVDLYAGFAFGSLDIGYVFYGYRDDSRFNYSEIYASYGIGALTLQAAFTPEYAETEDEAYYVSASYAHAFSETLTLTPQVGYSFGDGIKASLLGDAEDGYIDYSLVLTKSLDDGFEFAFGVHGNSENDLIGHKEKVVVSLKKNFAL